MFPDKALFQSIFGEINNEDFVNLYHYINDFKMLRSCERRLVPLSELDSWNFTDSEISHKNGYSFKVIFCDIEIEGREVTHWDQPLFEAVGTAVFGLAYADFDGKRKFLVHAKPEAGCFDIIEAAPTVQYEASVTECDYDAVGKRFFELCKNKNNVKTDVILSEEGGRFYHEQNRNILLQVDKNDFSDLPEGYFWLDFKTLNRMVQFNNCLNIQLRNLLSLLEM